MAIIKTYPLKSNYYGPDRLLLSDMQPDSEGNVSGDTRNLTLSSLKSFLGANAVLNLTTTGTSGASTYDANTNTLNVPVYEGDTYSLRALQKSGVSVPLKLNAASGTDSEVNFTEGANITLTRNSDTQITISATGGNAGVSSITNAFGTYISGTNNTAATGAVGLGTINLSASDGTSIATTRFLSKDNTWDVISASGSNTQFQYNNNGPFAGTPLMVITGNDEIQIGQQTNEQGKLIVSGQAAGTSGLIKIEGKSARGVTFSVQPETNVNYDVIFPDAGPGGNNKILESDTSGNLAWVSTPVPGPITASTGTANYLPKYSSSTALANSVIYESSSNIGIGTTSPSAKLQVNDASGTTQAIIGSGTQNLYVGVNGTNVDLKSSGSSAGTFSFTTGNTERIRITSTGNLGIGTTSPATKLDILDSVNQTAIRVTNNNYNNYLIQKRRTDNSQILGIQEFGSNGGLSLVTGGSQRLNVNNLGNVGIGTTSPSTKLDVNGTVNLTNLKVSGTQGTNGQALTSTGSGVGWATPPQGTITAVSGQSGISGSGTSGAVVLTNSDRGSTAVAALNFFKTIATPTNDVVASGNDDTVTLTAGGNTGIFINGQGSQVTIGLSAPTVLDRGGVKLVNATTQSTAANGLTTTAGRTYAMQLNSSGQAVVNVPWSGGSGGGISFSGTTSGGLATFTDSSTAGVSSKVTLNASGLMNFDADGNSAGSIDYDATGTRLKIGDLSSGSSGIVEIFTNGNRQFQIGVNGEIGLGTGGAQGTSGQVLTSAGNGSPATWSAAGGNVPANNVTGAGNTYEIPMWNNQSGGSGSYIGAGNGFTSAPFKSNSSGRAIVNTNILGGITFQNGSSGGAPVTIDGSTGTGGGYEIQLPQSIASSTSKVLGVNAISGSVMQTIWVDQPTSSTIEDGFVPLDIYQATSNIGGDEGDLSYIRQTQAHNNSTINKISFFVSSIGSSPEIRFALFDSANVKNGSGTCRVNAAKTSGLTAGTINEMALTDGEGTNLSYTCTPGKNLVLFFAIKNCTIAGSAALSNSGIGYQSESFVTIPTVDDPLSTTITQMGTDPNNKIIACHFYKS